MDDLVPTHCIFYLGGTHLHNASAWTFNSLLEVLDIALLLNQSGKMIYQNKNDATHMRPESQKRPPNVVRNSVEPSRNLVDSTLHIVTKPFPAYNVRLKLLDLFFIVNTGKFWIYDDVEAIILIFCFIQSVASTLGLAGRNEPEWKFPPLVFAFLF